jgi:hypothetical protein
MPSDAAANYDLAADGRWHRAHMLAGVPTGWRMNLRRDGPTPIPDASTITE